MTTDDSLLPVNLGEVKGYYKDEQGLICFPSEEHEMAAYVFVRREGKFYNPITASWLTPSAFDVEFSTVVPKRFGRASMYAKIEMMVKSVEDVMYYPRVEPGSIFVLNGVKYVNAMQPFQMPEPDKDWISNHVWSTCHEHLINLLGDEHVHILNWMAWNVQNPGKKILWAPIIVGTQGDGKTTLMKIMAAAMGTRNVKFVSPETLDSSFNGYAEGSCVVALEEIRVVGKSRHPIMEKLKPLITNDVIEVHEKFRAGRQVVNCTNYIAFTNHEDALVIDAHDRRWGVFRTKFKDRDELNAKLTPEYWKKLHSQIENNHGAIRSWLLDEDLSDFDPMVAPPITAAKLKMIGWSRSSAATEIEHVLGSRDGVTDHAVVTVALKSALQEHGYHVPAGHGLGKAMKELGFSQYDKTVKWDGTNSRGFYRVKSWENIPSTKDFKEALILKEVVHDDEMEVGNPFA